ncbi:hypothetical protein PRK78_003682 [Emydomyces testavorans]|uniref:Monooxygenase n=1 Tax=Emydomyces testavorans TaxID=2070801 RepID=A0AAF0IKU2_9EURO|nr:hypothetical protein PRK78_003682 [Emydomyces testavorans]
MTEKKLGFDPAALKEKYLIERNKRLRKDGVHQYRVAEGKLSHYTDDPYVEPGFHRPPIVEDVDVLIIGGGFGGQLAAARLLGHGVSCIRIIEKAGDFGGAWYWNRYPGAACDIESYIYMPLLEETGYIPSEKYVHGPELLQYSRLIGRHYGLYDKALFQTQVTGLIWSKPEARWITSTSRNDIVRARFVVTASGPLNKAKFPGVPGIETFKGHDFHTSRWDYQYTGGDSYGRLDRLADKRVGVIGTGATAIQIVPHLGRSAKHLYVFQRTPSSIGERRNAPTRLSWAHKLQPGWQQSRIDNFNTIIEGGKQIEDLVNDAATDILHNLSWFGVAATLNTDDASKIASELQLLDFQRMEKIRARVDATVKEPAVAEKLKPWYNQLCKRPCFSDDYLPTFNRPNVTLVDTDGKGVERITEKGIIANGKEYELDCIIYATGFQSGTDYSRRMNTMIIGEDGVSLTEHWKKGTRTLHGFLTRGFPNYFIISQIQSGLTPNFVDMLNEQAKHVAYIVSEAARHSIRTLQPTQKAEDEWVKSIMESGKRRHQFGSECTPGYFNYEGMATTFTLQQGPYGNGVREFIKLLKEWREAGKLPGLECSFEPAREPARSPTSKRQAFPSKTVRGA